MLITFHGTRGSLPVPGPSTLRYGGNTPCVAVRSRAGTLVVLDMGTGAYGLGQSLAATGAPLRGHVLITHTHWDHIQGLPFFAPFFRPGNEWDIYAPRGVRASLRETLSGQMQSTYFPLELKELGATIRYHDLVEGCFTLDEIAVEARYLHHTALTLGYRLTADGASLVYALDHEPFAPALATGTGPIEGADRDHVAFLAGADLVIHDAQYTAQEYPAKVGWGHGTIEYAVRVAGEAGVRHLSVAHHDPARGDDALDALLARSAEAAARAGLVLSAAVEGQTIELAGPGALARSRPDPAGASAIAAPSPIAGQADQRVVVAGRDPVRCRRLTELLRNDGLAAVSADAAAAPEIIAQRPCALILALDDLTEPEQRACLAASRSRAEAERPAVVLVARDPAARGAAGIADRLVEPFTDAYARARIGAWLMRRACRWKPPPTPTAEAGRLAALKALGILDRPADERLTRLVEFAGTVFRVPMAAVTLIDRDRQWFGASCGLAARETPREESFCAHIVADPAPLVVPDTLLDSRFADNPQVLGPPRLRFYAGHPLPPHEGHCLGTFCVADVSPRAFEAAEMHTLANFAALAQALLTQPRAGAGLRG